MDEQLQRDWEESKDSDMPWDKAKGAVQDAYDRTVQIRKERCCSDPFPVGTGRLSIRQDESREPPRRGSIGRAAFFVLATRARIARIRDGSPTPP